MLGVLTEKHISFAAAFERPDYMFLLCARILPVSSWINVAGQATIIREKPFISSDPGRPP